MNNENPEEIKQYYSNLYEDFMDILDKDYPDIYDNFQIQIKFRDTTVKTALAIRAVNGKRKAQVDELQKLIQNGTESDLTNLNNGEGIPFSANLDLVLIGVKVEKTNVFKSASKPLLLPFYYKKQGFDEIES